MTVLTVTFNVSLFVYSALFSISKNKLNYSLFFHLKLYPKCDKLFTIIMEESDIYEGLKKYFKFDSFKSKLQEKAVIEICQSKYSL